MVLPPGSQDVGVVVSLSTLQGTSGVIQWRIAGTEIIVYCDMEQVSQPAVQEDLDGSRWILPSLFKSYKLSFLCRTIPSLSGGKPARVSSSPTATTS